MELSPDQIRAREYLSRRGTCARVEVLRTQVREAFAAMEQALDAVPVAQRQRAPAAGKWSPHEILDHLVLSHEPAVAQLESMLRGVDAEGGAIPADLHRDERPEWDVSRRELGEVHRRFLALLDGATDEHSLEPKALIELVVKVGSEPRHWIEPFDWKAFAQAIRVHTLEHQNQLQRTLSA